MSKESSGNFVRRRRFIPAFLAKVLALTAISIAAGAGSVEAKPIDLHQQSAVGNLRPLGSLPGFRRHVRPDQFQALKASTVKVFAHTVDKKGNHWVRNCTGNKLNYEGTDYVASAAHCFVGDISSYNAGLSGPRQGSTKALDFIRNFEGIEIKDMSQRAIQSTDGGPATTIYKSPSLPMGTANGVAVGLRRGDDALLSITPYGSAPTTGDIYSRSFDQVEALAYNPAIREPEPGQQVAIYGAPLPRDIGISAVGRYVGRMNYSPVRNQTLDMVAIKAPNLAKDPCEPGSSGSTAMTADGHMLGGLSFGLELGFIGYGADARPSSGAPRSLPPDAYQSWDHIENTLGVNIPAVFNEICMYGVRDTNSLPNLVGGLGVYAAN